MGKKTKTELVLERAKEYILNSFENLNLKIDIGEFYFELENILKESRKLKKVCIASLVIQIIIENLSLDYVKKYSYYRTFENDVNKIFLKFRDKNLTRTDFLYNFFLDKVEEIFYKAHPDIKKFDNVAEAYIKMCYLSKSNSEFEEFKKIKEKELNELYQKDTSLFEKSAYLSKKIDQLYADYLFENDEAFNKHFGII